MTLIDVAAIEAWRTRGDALLVIAAEIPELVATAMHSAFTAIDGPHKRLAAGALAHAGYLAIVAVLDRLRQNTPVVPELERLPDAIERLRRIFADSCKVR